MKQGVDFGYGIKSTLVQCLVLTTTYFLNVQQGIDVMMPTIIIGALQTEGDNTVPGITVEQISWIGSLVYLSPPIGSLFLSLVQARLGHRACMAITNLIQLSSVLVVVLFPITVSTLYACSMLMGLSTGFATGISISYSGEVCEPKLRGSLTSALNVFYFVGFFFVSTTYAITKSWRQSLIITVVVPLANMIALSLTPNSPMWLLSRGKTDKARKVLMKLRGYVSEEKCAKEFQEMVQYVSLSSKLVRLPRLQHHRQHINHSVGAPARQEMPCAIDHNRLLDFVPAHRFRWTISRGYRVHVLGEIGTVLRVNVILVAWHNAHRVDPRERSFPDEKQKPGLQHLFRGVFLSQLLHDQVLHEPRGVYRLLQHIPPIRRRGPNWSRVFLLSSARNRKQNVKRDCRTL
ncbi:hypothetical protein ACI65C_010233 [Semiaphis heraclei]